MAEVIDADDLRNFLWQQLPETRDIIDALEKIEPSDGEEEGVAPYVGLYEYISEAFWWGVFEPALRQANTELISRYYGITEHLLEHSTDLVREGVEIRVISYLASCTQSQTYAGRRTREAIARANGSD